MKVDFNNLRIKTCKSYNDIVDTLNKAMVNNHKEGDEIFIYEDDISKKLDRLRNCLVGLICTFEEGNDEFRDVSEEVELKVFNGEG